MYLLLPQTLILTTTALLLSSSNIAFAAAESIVSVDESTVDTVDTIRTATATFTIDNDDLFNMPSFTFTGMDSDNGGDDAAAFTKVKATKRTMDSGSEQTVWEGTMTEADRVGFATLVRIANGDVAGQFSTETTTYSLVKVPDGTLQLRSQHWIDIPEEEQEEEASGSMDLPSVDLLTAEVSIQPDLSGETTTSEGEGTALEGPGGGRMLRGDRKLTNDAVVVDVLVLITNRAMCEYAGLSHGCSSYSEANRLPIESRIPLLQSETNSAMQGVGVNVEIRIVDIKYLKSDYDGDVSSETLNLIGDDVNIQAWRDEAGADLVAMITGGSGGIARVNSFQSVTGFKNFNSFTFTHEVSLSGKARQHALFRSLIFQTQTLFSLPVKAGP